MGAGWKLSRRLLGLAIAGTLTAPLLATAGPAAAAGSSGRWRAGAGAAGPGTAKGQGAARGQGAAKGLGQSAGGVAQITPARAARITPARTVRLSVAAQRALLRSYASSLGLPARDITGIRPGSLHAARQPGTAAQWATASFLPAKNAPAAVQLRFQDGASTVVFTRAAGHGWRLAQAGGRLGCPGVLPAAIRLAWRLPSPGGCAAPGPLVMAPRLARHRRWRRRAAGPSPAVIVSAALANVGVGDDPASTRWGFDCDPYTTLVGVVAGARRCRTDPHFAVHDENQLWCADFAKWVWEQGGVSTDLAALTPAAASFYTWGKLQGERMPADSGVPAPGDAVVFYPATERPGASYADHVGIVTAVNPDGTVNLVNGDFMGESNITVQASEEVSLASWAAAMWGRGEKWVFVSPLG
jgi:hypothetical protein